MSIGSNIKRRRIELGLSQQELADIMGYKTRSTIAKIESGENDISQKKLQKIAEKLDISVEELITGIKSSNGMTFLYQNIEPMQNPNSNKTVAIILAGGKSIRNHQNIPNQFINILGKPIIVYTLEAYQNHPSIDDIYIVCLKGWEQIVNAYAKEYGITKLRGLIPSAPTGIQSVQNGLDYISTFYSENDYIVFQESTRPLVSVDMISRLLKETYEKGSATICQPTKEKVQFYVENDNAKYLDRNKVVDLQSPEAYKISIIQNAFDKAKKTNHVLDESCCALLLYNLGIKINFIEGCLNNIKIVRQEDIAVFTTLVKSLIDY